LGAVIGDGLVSSAILYFLFSCSRICDANIGGKLKIKKKERFLFIGDDHVEDYLGEG
jgi:hypothetical protein